MVAIIMVILTLNYIKTSVISILSVSIEMIIMMRNEDEDKG